LTLVRRSADDGADPWSARRRPPRGAVDRGRLRGSAGLSSRETSAMIGWRRRCWGAAGRAIAGGPTGNSWRGGRGIEFFEHWRGHLAWEPVSWRALALGRGLDGFALFWHRFSGFFNHNGYPYKFPVFSVRSAVRRGSGLKFITIGGRRAQEGLTSRASPTLLIRFFAEQRHSLDCFRIEQPQKY